MVDQMPSHNDALLIIAELQSSLSKAEEELKNQKTLCETIHHSWDDQLRQNREAFKDYKQALSFAVGALEKIETLACQCYAGCGPCLNDCNDIARYKLRKIKELIK